MSPTQQPSGRRSPRGSPTRTPARERAQAREQAQAREPAPAAIPAPPPPVGYSGTPLHLKLGIRPGHRVLLRGLPAGFDTRVLDPDGTATLHRRAAGAGYDVVLLFCPDHRTLAATLPDAMTRTATAGRCWVAWPKRASGVPTDLTDTVVRAAGLAESGWVDVKVCAVDQVWSGLCLVRRRENR